MKNAKLIYLFLTLAFFATTASAQETVSDPGRKAKEIHDLASSDVIYVQDELKALYYQNLQIIELLGEIRDVLDQKLENTKS